MLQRAELACACDTHEHHTDEARAESPAPVRGSPRPKTPHSFGGRAELGSLASVAQSGLFVIIASSALPLGIDPLDRPALFASERVEAGSV
jgi:hypothetical protein